MMRAGVLASALLLRGADAHDALNAFNQADARSRRAPAEARSAILSWRDSYSLIETSAEVMLAAADLATNHQLAIWDSVILSAAGEAGCRLLLSEDFQEGFTWKGVTVTNPFSTSKHELLGDLLGT
jgi:predicted nucleic acid-binding protein